MVKLRRKTNVEEISAASMSDLAFLLLVFFMVASVFYVKEGILANLPKKDSSPQMVERDTLGTSPTHQVRQREAVCIGKASPLVPGVYGRDPAHDLEAMTRL